MLKSAMIATLGLLAIAGVAAYFAVGQFAANTMKPAYNPEKHRLLYVAGGCFWCVEAIFEDLNGIVEVESGYAGGLKPNPTYAEVSAGITGHAEVVKIAYDPEVVTADDLLRIFMTTHNPTTLNRQGPDVGTQYRSAIFYRDDAEKALALRIIEEISKEGIYKDKIVTSVEPLKNYARAEEYHQDYFRRYESASEIERMGMNSGYCAAIIEPKVRKFREKYAARLRKGG